jgi:hypothetical protein
VEVARVIHSPYFGSAAGRRVLIIVAWMCISHKS